MSEFSVQIDVSNALENKRHEEIDKKHTSIAVITVLTLLECRKVGEPNRRKMSPYAIKRNKTAFFLVDAFFFKNSHI